MIQISYKNNMTFEEFDLNEKTKKALKEMGYVNPTPIQEQAIPMVLKGSDFIRTIKNGNRKNSLL